MRREARTVFVSRVRFLTNFTWKWNVSTNYSRIF